MEITGHGLYRAEHRALRELYAVARQLCGRWERLAEAGRRPCRDVLRRGAEPRRGSCSPLGRRQQQRGVHGCPARPGIEQTSISGAARRRRRRPAAGARPGGWGARCSTSGASRPCSAASAGLARHAANGYAQASAVDFEARLGRLIEEAARRRSSWLRPRPARWCRRDKPRWARQETAHGGGRRDHQRGDQPSALGHRRTRFALRVAPRSGGCRSRQLHAIEGDGAGGSDAHRAAVELHAAALARAAGKKKS